MENDPKGANDAVSALKKLEGAAKLAGAAVAGIVIGKVFGKLADIAKASVGEFRKQDMALTKLSASLHYASNMSIQDFDRISKAASAIEFSSLEDGADILSKFSELAMKGLAASDAITVVSTATDMAAVGLGSFESNVNSLARSLGGELPKDLVRINGELSQLSKEQLKAGEALKILNGQFKGMSETITGVTTTGLSKQFEDKVTELRRVLGGAFDIVATGFRQAMIPAVENLTLWLSQTLPAVISKIYSAVRYVGDLIAATFSNESAGKYGLTFSTPPVMPRSNGCWILEAI
jgi:hypothetical protein